MLRLLSSFALRATALVVIGWFALGLPAQAQFLDLAFQRLDARTQSINYLERGAQVAAMARDGAGRLVVAGRFALLAGAPVGHIARLLPTGAPDPTFNPGGIGANGEILQLVALPGGQWLIGGSFTRYNGTPVKRLARLTANGTLDPTFNPGGAGADDAVTALAVDGSGRVLAAGSFAAFNGQPAFGIVRLLATGAVDPTFSSGQGLKLTPNRPHYYFPTQLVIDLSGRILLVGADSYDGTPTGTLTRLLPTGALDPTFNPGGTFNAYIGDVAVLPTGRLLVAGGYFTHNGTTVPGGVLRLLDSGALDGSFTPPPVLADTTAIADVLAVLPGGGVLVAPYYLPVVRLTATGALDPTFAPTPFTVDGEVKTMVALPTGGVALGGYFDQVGTHQTRCVGQIRPQGGADPTFTGPYIQQRAAVRGMVRLPSDSLAMLGFDQLNGQVGQQVVRMLPDGQPDLAFSLDISISSTTYVSGLATTARGQLLATDGSRIWRLTRTGAIDPGFATGTGVLATERITAITAQPDGKLLVGGKFTSYDGRPATNLIRLLATGAIDPTFTAPLMRPGATVSRICVRPDAHILYSIPGNGTEATITAVLPTGVPDPDFNGGQPLVTRRSVGQLVARPDTTVLVIANDQYFFSSLNLFLGPVGRITRTGTVDPTFVLDPSLTPIDRFSAAVVQPDGGILFVTTPRADARLQRLRPDGALDPTFTPVEVGTGVVGETVTNMVLQSNNRIVLAGGFADVAGTPFPGLARIAGVPLGVSADAPTTAATTAVYPNPARGAFTIRRPNGRAATASLVDAVGRTVGRWPLASAEQVVRADGLPVGLYVLRVQDAAGAVSSHRLVLE